VEHWPLSEHLLQFSFLVPSGFVARTQPPELEGAGLHMQDEAVADAVTVSSSWTVSSCSFDVTEQETDRAQSKEQAAMVRRRMGDLYWLGCGDDRAPA
jgi:hypothetical protein